MLTVAEEEGKKEKEMNDSLQVSWIRHDNLNILSAGRYTYTSDQRYIALHESGKTETVNGSVDTETWILRIRPVEMRDEGSYECQVSSMPVNSYLVHLKVVGTRKKERYKS